MVSHGYLAGGIRRRSFLGLQSAFWYGGLRRSLTDGIERCIGQVHGWRDKVESGRSLYALGYRVATKASCHSSELVIFIYSTCNDTIPTASGSGQDIPLMHVSMSAKHGFPDASAETDGHDEPYVKRHHHEPFRHVCQRDRSRKGRGKGLT